MKKNSESPLTVIARAVGEYFQAGERGETPDLQQFCDGYPTVRTELHQALSDVVRLREHLPEPLSDPDDDSERHVSPFSDEVLAEIPAHLRELIERMRQHPPRPDRYEKREGVGRGGMGVVTSAFDRDLRRELAVKEIRASRREASDPSTLTRTLARFVEEAQVAAQLDHPGIVPVHDLAIDAEGQIFFTMKLVRGESLRSVYDKVLEGEDEWSTTRAVGVLQRVCEALAFAHSRKVIHRDLKPDNVMVGRFGEVYVMDWGLARVDAGEGITPVGVSRRGRESRIRTERHETPSGHDSPLGTTEGDVLGTPAYMSPEQARGDQAVVGPPTDVYAVGAMLYELLGGTPPYTLPGQTPEGRAIVEWIGEGPPEPLRRGPRGSIPAELIAICERAMARDVRQRYRSMQDLADDLRAYLERRVVRAYRTGAVAEFKKWVSRNRTTAALLLSLIVVSIASAGLVAWKEQQRAKEALNRERVAQAGELAVQRQADMLLAPELLLSAVNLGPIHPASAHVFRDWLDRVAELEARAPAYTAELAELRSSGTPIEVEPAEDDELANRLITLRRLTEENLTVVERARRRLKVGGLTPAERARADELRELASEEVRILVPEIEARREQVRALEHAQERDRPWRFESEELQEEHDALAGLVSKLDDLIHPRFGVRREVESFHRRALRLAEETIEAHAEAWAEAIETIADEDLCPAYGGLVLTPQVGLVPLGFNAETDLYEFWHVLSGERPVPDGEGGYEIVAETGVVLVLVPGGETRMGAQAEDSKQPHYDPRATAREGPVHTVTLEPYFLSKYELTQGQWMRAGRDNPSEWWAGRHLLEWGAVSRTHPVEQVTWSESRDVLRRYALTLPTEAQWEHAARAGEGTVFWSGSDYESLRGRENLADRSLGSTGFTNRVDETVDDGHPITSRVDAFDANAWGFVGIAGNVAEWCLDWLWEKDYEAPTDPRNGRHQTAGRTWRAARGGSFRTTDEYARIAYRRRVKPHHFDQILGLRPCRPLDANGEANENERR